MINPDSPATVRQQQNLATFVLGAPTYGDNSRAEFVRAADNSVALAVDAHVIRWLNPADVARLIQWLGRRVDEVENHA